MFEQMNLISKNLGTCTQTANQCGEHTLRLSQQVVLDIGIDQDNVTNLPDKFRWIIAAALHVCYGRRQFVMENGYIGLGPAAMQNGDILCVLFGGSVPYVLRATDTNGLYRVIGERAMFMELCKER